MNSNTRDALKTFIEAVCNMFNGNPMFSEADQRKLFRCADALAEKLDSDETIP